MSSIVGFIAEYLKNELEIHGIVGEINILCEYYWNGANFFWDLSSKTEINFPCPYWSQAFLMRSGWQAQIF